MIITQLVPWNHRSLQKKARQEDQQGEEGLREEGRKVRYRASSEEKEDPRRRQREGNIFSPEPPEESTL